MPNDHFNADLEAFIREALNTQLTDRVENLGNEQLKEIAQRAGIRGEDWNRLCEDLDEKLERGRNFLSSGNFSDAIPELDSAAALAPYRADVVYDCGRAHLLRWLESGAKDSRDRAEELFRKCLRIEGGHAGAAQGIAELSSLRKKKSKNHKPGKVLAAIAGVLALMGGLLFWLGSNDGDESDFSGLLSTATKQYAGNRYLLIQLPANQKEASEFCQKLGGHLVTVDDESENRWLYRTFGDEMARFKMNAWLGASDAANEGKWVWEDDQPVDFTNWVEGGPNNIRNEDGAVMVASSDKWNDAIASKKWWFFCEWETWPPQLASDIEIAKLKDLLGPPE